MCRFSFYPHEEGKWEAMVSALNLSEKVQNDTFRIWLLVKKVKTTSCVNEKCNGQLTWGRGKVCFGTYVFVASL